MSIFDHLVKNNLIPPEQSRITPKRFRIYRIPDSTLHPYMVKINYEAIQASIIHILYIKLPFLSRTTGLSVTLWRSRYTLINHS